MIIQKADYEDLENILSLQKICYVSEAQIINDYTIQPLWQTFDEIKKEFETHCFLKAIENERIIGSIRALEKNKTCHIFKLFVRPDLQNKGIGGELINEIEKIFSHCNRFELFTGKKSIKNIAFYEKHGYKIYKSDNPAFVFMEKFI